MINWVVAGLSDIHEFCMTVACCEQVCNDIIETEAGGDGMADISHEKENYPDYLDYLYPDLTDI